MPLSLGYHNKKPIYNEHNVASNKCEFCDLAPCYCDEFGLNSTDAMYALVNGGDAALWEFLEGYYNYIFGNGYYPKPTEYPAKIRYKNEYFDVAKPLSQESN